MPDQPFSCQQEKLKDLGDTLQAVMKSSGPFYFDRNGTFQANQSSPDHARYPQELANCPILVARGRTDFAALSQAVQDFVSGSGHIMTTHIALIRHAHYQQLPDTPSAWQPFPIN